jgi:hypothetical protein
MNSDSDFHESYDFIVIYGPYSIYTCRMRISLRMLHICPNVGWDVGVIVACPKASNTIIF